MDLDVGEWGSTLIPSPTSHHVTMIPNPLPNDPAIVMAARQESSGLNLRLQYTLNSVSQAKRMLECSSRSTLETRYNNPITIRGQKHPTNVSIDCNTGVYISTVKPALEAICTRGGQKNQKSDFELAN